MPTHQIPTLPVVVPLGLLMFAAMLWLLHRRGAVTALRVLVAAVVCVYGVGVVANTILPIYTGRVDDYGQSWTVYLNLAPLGDYELADALTNVVVFLPLGVLLPIVARVDSALRVLVCGFVLSLTMEAVQLANSVTGHGGHVADINDLLANTLGAPLGYAVLRAAMLLPPVARLVAATTWPAGRRGSGSRRVERLTERAHDRQ
ncbi:VanZ family protein [Aeromicrobium chenweiae]|uniref:VanZ family protein n=1 Tax=Aeromicrobium chenweiae TaxID=2079793 RepID=A0A2S0WLV3_9ACTN|nr:VanZ family protein [Aeromicrobium chenweiae]AWB92297.1 VanZ family protein [Aeromicrobium chenweiae]TGN31419.1 VanZ family protein [Aeromicrobium chenweiae]